MLTALVPVRSEHKMINDQLTAPRKKIGKTFLTARRIKNVILFDSHPRECPARFTQRVALASEFLLFF